MANSKSLPLLLSLILLGSIFSMVEFETREISHPSLMIGGSDGIDEIFNYAHHIFRYHKKINSEEVNANEGNLEDIKSLDVNSDNINSQKNCKGIKEISYEEIK